MALYKQGATDYLTVVTSQTALLQTQLEALNLDTLQLTASVDLIRALGGGWEDSASAKNTLATLVSDPRQALAPGVSQEVHR
jgi:outer membrane protein TolC